ncbi:unnamed protein product, partial [Phaeothamnion confervicola]
SSAVPGQEKALKHSFLWKAYRPKRYSFEVLECARRLLMTGVLVFMAPENQPIFACLFELSFSSSLRSPSPSTTRWIHSSTAPVWPLFSSTSSCPWPF